MAVTNPPGEISTLLKLLVARLLSGEEETPPTFWLSLHSEGGEAGAEEHSGGSYVRVLAAFEGINDGDSIVFINTADVAFPAAQTSQGEVMYVGAFDAPSAGNFLCSWLVSTPATLLPGYAWVIPLSDLVISVE